MEQKVALGILHPENLCLRHQAHVGLAIDEDELGRLLAHVNDGHVRRCDGPPGHVLAHAFPVVVVRQLSQRFRQRRRRRPPALQARRAEPAVFVEQVVAAIHRIDEKIPVRVDHEAQVDLSDGRFHRLAIDQYEDRGAPADENLGRLGRDRNHGELRFAAIEIREYAVERDDDAVGRKVRFHFGAKLDGRLRRPRRERREARFQNLETRDAHLPVVEINFGVRGNLERSEDRRSTLR